VIETVGIGVKTALTVSVVAAGNEQGLVVSVAQATSPDQPVRVLAPIGAAVIEMASPTVATQGLAQPAPPSVIETVPLPAGEAPAVIVAQAGTVVVHGAAAA
jgi:hypothetical protein